MADFPDVPNTPGVPTVFRAAGDIDTPVQPLTSDDAGLAASAPRWGIFTADGSPSLDVDSVISVEYRADSTVSDYAIENGGFVSYNKVDRPYESRVRLARSGASVDRTAFLQALQSLKSSVELVTIVTPEQVYENANVTGYDVGRSATEGAQMLVAELQLQEIRQAPATAYSNTRDPSGADAVNDGAVQASPSATTVGPPA